MKQIEEMARDIFETGVAIDGIDLAFASVYGADNDSDTHFMRIAKQLYKKGYRKQSEVAREIFEEIEKIIDEKYNRFVFKSQPYDADEEIEAIINYSDCVSDGIAELKKKYTEGYISPLHLVKNDSKPKVKKC